VTGDGPASILTGARAALRPSPERPDWDQLRPDWPNSAASRFIVAEGLCWHVQTLDAAGADAPLVLLIHGTGASTHSWAGLAVHLKGRFRIVMIDLPGHGFTERPGSAGLTLPGMAASLSGLCRTLGVEPDIVVGHSAGAAVLARMCLDGGINPRTLVSINGAFEPFRGGASGLFSSIARVLFLNPLTPRLFAWRARDPALVARLIRQTGSDIGADALKRYRTLFICPDHVAGALGMMANWDLRPLVRDLPRLAPRMLLIVCGRDAAIAPEVGFRVRDLLGERGAIVEYVRELGHLAHEERPEDVARMILEYGLTGPR
jgi:magnesium chelatase accessory protein